jgi:hypothetical protein
VQVAWANLGNWTNPEGKEREFFGDIYNEPEVYEYLLSVGNISWQYKDCWIQADRAMDEAAVWVS